MQTTLPQEDVCIKICLFLINLPFNHTALTHHPGRYQVHVIVHAPRRSYYHGDFLRASEFGAQLIKQQTKKILVVEKRFIYLNHPKSLHKIHKPFISSSRQFPTDEKSEWGLLHKQTEEGCYCVWFTHILWHEIQ